MSFQPVVPLSGIAGWQFVQRTYDRQLESFTSAPQIQRDIDYFRENIRDAREVGDLVTDYRLLKVALGAYGLSEDLDKPAFVRKILEEGTIDPDSFANRLNNDNYKDLARMFSYGNGDGELKIVSVQIDRVVEQYRVRAFEEAVGEVDNDMRLSLNFQREIGKIAEADSSERAGWFKVMGSLPLREVVEAGFGLPQAFSQLDVDRQAEILADKAEIEFGERSVAVFSDPENVDAMIRKFQFRRQAEAGPSPLTPGYGALQVLQAGSGLYGGALGSLGIANLLLSNS